MFGLKSKTSEVLNHWVSFAEGFNTPPLEFYAGVEKELAARKVPGLEVSQVEFAEGGLLSDKRVYLRMLRERLAFDICAAPFGTGYFFSCRTVYVPAVIRFWHLLVIVTVFGGLFVSLYSLLDHLTMAAGATFALIIALGFVMRNTVAMGLSDLDASLLKTPAIGPIYERFFRKETYFRHDTRLMYLEVVPTVVKSLAEDATGAKGVKLVRQYELAPVLGELYKPCLPRPQSPAAQ